MSYVEASDTSLRKTGQIKLHGPSGFAGMRKAGALVAKCLDELTDIIKPGVPTSRIDDFVPALAFRAGPYPATLMYRGYRYSTCTSINHVVCHGMPGDRVLKDNDIVNVDVTFIVEGWYGDSSRMYAIGPIARKAERLIEVTYEAMMRGIAAVKPGATTGDIGHAIQSFVEPQGMSVVRDFCGHGLGRLFHDEPKIIHVRRPGAGRPPRRRPAAQPRLVLHHRADDQSRQAAREDPVRRLDGGDAGPLAVSPVRALGRRDSDRLRNLHAVGTPSGKAAGRSRTFALASSEFPDFGLVAACRHRAPPTVASARGIDKINCTGRRLALPNEPSGFTAEELHGFTRQRNEKNSSASFQTHGSIRLKRRHRGRTGGNVI